MVAQTGVESFGCCLPRIPGKFCTLINSSVYWNKDLINAEALSQRLSGAAATQPQPEVYIRGDRHVDYENVIKVMAAAQRAGIQKLGFVTEPSE
jgi:biopolymer transport protein ExbD